VAIAAGILLAARLAWPLLIGLTFTAVGVSHPGLAPDQSFAAGVNNLTHNGADFFIANLQLVKLKALQLIYEGRFLTILSMFFVGALIGRLRVYTDLAKRRVWLIWTFVVCLPLGAIANLSLIPFEHAANAYPPTSDWLAFQSLVAIAAPALCLAYASGFALLWCGRLNGALAMLAPVGRTALTSYVSQTLFCMAAFTWAGWGRGFGATQCLGAAVVIFATQCVLSRLWLRAFRFGPLEWLWRCATYGEIIPIRRPLMLRDAAATI
jgi:uncharacterized protein